MMYDAKGRQRVAKETSHHQEIMIGQEFFLDNDVSMQIYHYLHPKDLFCFFSCSHSMRNFIIHHGNKMAKICMHHLPLQLGAETNYQVDFIQGNSFSSKSMLLDHVLNKTEAANLLLIDANTMEESRRRARELLLHGTGQKSTAKFNPQNNEHTASPAAVTVECHYQNNITKSSASCWVNYILDRDACKSSGKDREIHRFVKAWLDCLFSSSHHQHPSENDCVFGMWRWTCKHQKLNGHGIAGVGVTIRCAAASTAECQQGTDDVMELRLTRKY